MMVSVITIASLQVARVEVRESMAVDEMARARLAARSGVECVVCKIQSDSTWRTTYSSGVTGVLSNLSNNLTGTGSFEFSLIDSDGDLNDNPDDAVTIRCVGKAGKARHVIEVQMQPSGEGLASLSVPLHSSGNMDVTTSLTTDRAVSSNGNVKVSGSGSVIGNAQAAGDITGSVTGSKNKNMTPPLEMPDSTNVFDYYLSNGTPIKYGELTAGKSERGAQCDTQSLWLAGD